MIRSSVIWHWMSVVKPRKNLHILVELDDHTLISGNMADVDGVRSFISDNPLDRSKSAVYSEDEILQWCVAPEAD